MMKIIKTEQAPAAIGPYSQAVAANGFLFASGQIPPAPGTGETAGSAIEEQAERVCENIKGILDASGLTFEDAVKTTCSSRQRISTRKSSGKRSFRELERASRRVWRIKRILGPPFEREARRLIMISHNIRGAAFLSRRPSSPSVHLCPNIGGTVRETEYAGSSVSARYRRVPKRGERSAAEPEA